MKKTLFLCGLLFFALAGCEQKVQEEVSNQQQVKINKDMKQETKKEIPLKDEMIKEDTKKDKIEDTEENIYVNEDLGFKLTLPKEWKDYLAKEFKNGNSFSVEIYLETNDKDAFTTLKENGKIYWEVMSISVSGLDDFNKLKNSKDCIENPNTPLCPKEPYLEDLKNVYIINYGQDSPIDLEFKKKIYMFNSSNMQGLDFKTHFEKYFKLELINK